MQKLIKAACGQTMKGKSYTERQPKGKFSGFIVPLQVLGIVGALDPHTHKVNQANIQGEGKLEAEGVRPQRQADPIGGMGGGAANTLGTASALHRCIMLLKC